MNKKFVSTAFSLLLFTAMVNASLTLSVRAALTETAIVDTNKNIRFFRLFVGYNGVDRPLRFAEQDAQDMHDWVTAYPSHPRSINTTLIGNQATWNNIDDWFRSAIVNANRGDIVVFYFAGHGDKDHLQTIGRFIFPDDLRDWFNAFRPGVSFAVILDSCWSAFFSATVKVESNTVFLRRRTEFIAQPGWTLDASFSLLDGWVQFSYTFRCLSLALDPVGDYLTTKADKNGDGITTLREVYQDTTESPWGFVGDDDGDGMVDEDDVEHFSDGYYVWHGYIDNDGDGNIDEDPAPKYVDLVTVSETLAVFYNTVIGTKLAPLYGAAVKVAVIAENLSWADEIYDEFTNPAVYPLVLGPYANVVYTARGSSVDPAWISGAVTGIDASDARLIIHIFSGPVSRAFVIEWATVKPDACLVGIDVLGQETPLHWTATSGLAEGETLFLEASGMMVQWQAGRLEVVWAPDQPNSRIWAIPQWMYPYPTDVNQDGYRTITDIAIVSYAIGTSPGDLRWQFVADVNNDWVIDADDLTPVAFDYGKPIPLPLG